MNFLDRTESYIADQFGPAMTAELFGSAAQPGVWQGPFVSRHGAHLVLIRDIERGRHPALEEVIGRVRQQFARARAEEQVREATQQVVDAYTVKMLYQQNGAE